MTTWLLTVSGAIDELQQFSQSWESISWDNSRCEALRVFIFGLTIRTCVKQKTHLYLQMTHTFPFFYHISYTLPIWEIRSWIFLLSKVTPLLILMQQHENTRLLAPTCSGCSKLDWLWHHGNLLWHCQMCYIEIRCPVLQNLAICLLQTNQFLVWPKCTCVFCGTTTAQWVCLHPNGSRKYYFNRNSQD